MSIDLKSALANSRRIVAIHAVDFSGDVSIMVSGADARGAESECNATVTRADFLAAVASELNVRIVPADAIVIERRELPEVTREYEHGYYAVGDRTYGADFDHRAEALRRLAAAEYIDAHQSIDKAQVVALSNLIRTALAEGREILPGFNDDLARRLYLAGVRIEVTA